jgi:colicin import membrane protein
MSADQQLPRDPTAATGILAALAEKDQDESRCRYPTCSEPRQAATGSGRPSAYCSNPEHNAVSNHRARQQLKSIAAGMVSEGAAKREQPGAVRVAPVESLRGTVVSAVLQLQTNLERYLVALSELADPDLITAQIQAVMDQTETRLAEAQQNLSNERSLRLAAEGARQSALEEAQTERDAAEEAIRRMEEAEAGYLLLQEQTRRQIAEIQAERDATVERMLTETQGKIEQILQQTRETVARAEAQTAEAQEQARIAEARATAAETEARAQIVAAERLVSQANANVQRERDEVARLLKELADIRKQGEVERAESRMELERLRGELAGARKQIEAERVESSTTLERERREVDRLRSELREARLHTEQAVQRAEKLAALTDELRAQLVQAQAKTQQNPKQD